MGLSLGQHRRSGPPRNGSRLHQHAHTTATHGSHKRWLQLLWSLPH
ncbi:hypothetical protein ACFPRL_36070 [Pseudoclavibacter helvolus]